MRWETELCGVRRGHCRRRHGDSSYLRRLIPDKVSGAREADSLTVVEEWRLARVGEGCRPGSDEPE